MHTANWSHYVREGDSEQNTPEESIIFCSQIRELILARQHYVPNRQKLDTTALKLQPHFSKIDNSLSIAV